MAIAMPVDDRKWPVRQILLIAKPLMLGLPHATENSVYSNLYKLRSAASSSCSSKRFPPRHFFDEERLNQRIEGWNRLNGSKKPLDEATNREIHQIFLARLRYPQGIVNHVTMLRDERSEAFVRRAPSLVKVPTVILHGSEDPLFPPDHGQALAHAIEHAEYFLVDGMGHVPNQHFYGLYIDILKRQALQAQAMEQMPAAR